MLPKLNRLSHKQQHLYLFDVFLALLRSPEYVQSVRENNRSFWNMSLLILKQIFTSVSSVQTLNQYLIAVLTAWYF